MKDVGDLSPEVPDRGSALPSPRSKSEPEREVTRGIAPQSLVTVKSRQVPLEVCTVQALPPLAGEVI